MERKNQNTKEYSHIPKASNLIDGSRSVFVEGLHRAKILSFIQHDLHLKGIVLRIEAEALLIAVLNLSVLEKREILEWISIKERLKGCRFILDRHNSKLGISNKFLN